MQRYIVTIQEVCKLPLHHAVLALLTEGESHGYELKGRFEEAIGPQWGGLNIGHLYQILDRLVRDGCVTRSQVAQPDRPDKTLYRLTSAGQEEVRQWATSAWVRTGGFRDELFLKLFGASVLGSDAWRLRHGAAHDLSLRTRRTVTLRRTHTADPLVCLLLDAAIAHTKADLGLVEGAVERLAPLTEPKPGASGREVPLEHPERLPEQAPREQSG